jgi:hypothetical protein
MLQDNIPIAGALVAKNNVTTSETMLLRVWLRQARMQNCQGNAFVVQCVSFGFVLTAPSLDNTCLDPPGTHRSLSTTKVRVFWGMCEHHTSFYCSVKRSLETCQNNCNHKDHHHTGVMTKWRHSTNVMLPIYGYTQPTYTTSDFVIRLFGRC